MANDQAKTVKGVLAEFRGLGAPGGAVAGQIDREALEERLKVVENDSSKEHILWIVILGIAFIVVLLIVLICRQFSKAGSCCHHGIRFWSRWHYGTSARGRAGNYSVQDVIVWYQV